MAEIWGREQERWITHYSSVHRILLVGEGDFSFSCCLAMAFRSATNIVATSFDTYDKLMVNYKNAYSNLAALGIMGATLFHGVDVTRMKIHPHLGSQKFDRIIFNFPHAGFYGKEDNPDLILMHRNLVRGFLANASTMLWPDGEIHVNHKTKAPFDGWRIENLAAECSLLFIGQDDFRIEDYPGYQNKRGSGSRPDEPFHLGECRTFRFKLYPHVVDFLKMGTKFEQVHTIPQNFQISVNMNQPSLSRLAYGDGNMSNEQTYRANGLGECRRIFSRYLDNVEETFGCSISYDDLRRSVYEALRFGYETYMGSGQGRGLRGYIDVLEELRSLSILRSERLRQRLSGLDRLY